jgi:DNA-directed RNA polymerase II subunit RPB2
MSSFSSELVEITQQDCWEVIGTYFQDKGLVRQQLDSFNEFIENTMQEIIDENFSLRVETQTQHSGGQEDVPRRYQIEFGQVYLSYPQMVEAEGGTGNMFPSQARLRNLTYAAPCYLDMTKDVRRLETQTDEWIIEEQDSEPQKIFIGKGT